jgi:hypothetical protein
VTDQEGASEQSGAPFLRDVQQPTLAGTITALRDGTDGHPVLESITIDPRGPILMVEEVGANERLGKIWFPARME